MLRKSMLGLFGVTVLTLLSACDSEDILNEPESGSDTEVSVSINNESFSTATPFEITPKSPTFDLSWTSSGRTDIYISNAPEVNDTSESIYGYNLGSSALTCQIDSSYLEIDCDLNDALYGGSADISALVTEVPMTLYVVVTQTNFTLTSDEVKTTSLPLLLH